MIIRCSLQSVSRFLGWDPEYIQNNEYYKISKLRQIALLLGYVLLITFLLCATHFNNQYRKHPKQLRKKQEQLNSQEYIENDDQFNFFDEKNDTIEDFMKSFEQDKFDK